jgi:hypothetical protein
MFEFINLASEDELDPFNSNNINNNNNMECLTNYLTVASQLKPNDNIKLCGLRRRVKFITTYNNVLINLVANKFKKSTSIGFSLTYKMISNPNECKSTFSIDKIKRITILKAFFFQKKIKWFNLQPKYQSI